MPHALEAWSLTHWTARKLLDMLILSDLCQTHRASQVALVIKNQEAPTGSLGREDPLGGGHGNPLQCSCLENPMDRGAWWATVHGVTKRRSRLK